MANTLQVIVYPVSDITVAKAFYNTFLGTEPYADSPYYVGYKIGDQEIGLDPNATDGPIAYIDVQDITACIAVITNSGGKIVKEPTDVGGGLVIAQVTDPAGNVLGFRQQPAAQL